MKTQVFLASTAFGVATLSAAIDEGHFGSGTRRILVLSNNAVMPEATPGIERIGGWDSLQTRFDQVLDHNAAVAPLHPSAWLPRAQELPMWERHFRAVWGIGDSEVHLVVESIQASPALALARIFANASVDVYADGLMSYGPTRTTLPDDVAYRIERLLHLDLVPGLTPLLLADWEVTPVLIGGPAFRAVIDQLGPPSRQAQGAVGGAATPGAVLVVGQYLAAAGLLTEAEEVDLYQQMILSAGRRHQQRVLFKPHPSAPLGQQSALLAFAADAGVQLEVITGLELAESWFATGSISLVVGCFSTALATASALYDLPVARLGSELLLERLTPFHNSNRIPATIVDAVLPDLADPSAPPPVLPSELSRLVAAVGYVMQPVRYPGLRADAAEFLEQFPALRPRYFRRLRLTRLDLPGRLPRREQPLNFGRRVWRGVRRRGGRQFLKVRGAYRRRLGGRTLV